MSYYFALCSSEMYQQKYLEFLLEHYHELHLPYAFPETFSYLASPVLMGKGCFLCFNDEYEVIGAFGFIFGTGEHEYTDTDIVQIQAVFILKHYRKSYLFLHSLQFFIQYLAQQRGEVREIRFWSPADEPLRRLFDKLAQRVASVQMEFGTLDEYRASFEAWQAYAAKFPVEKYFDL
ncbi:hypothetical protein NDK47_13945 [Brevibacillus ruminantium]|uniref:GNAT family N-acetyltransferase n=1 Tax=Brevibacillus ruminantium TaxID=2950604 RepID=A0ABY4W8E5_9BACL|nr:hypothetical protein [Brevibacillus ruminantium]USG63292.1 hypothetical protein NDK47_13945 [Brevibacillus ruminantium]